MTMKGAPVAGSSSMSKTCAMCCVSIAPAARASRWKRTKVGSPGWASDAEIILSATCRPVPVWRAS